VPINDDANARGGDRHDRGVGPDPSVHDELVRSVFENYMDLLSQQNAMRLGGELPPNPMDTQGGPVTIDRHAHDAAGPPTGEATHTLEGDPRPGDEGYHARPEGHRGGVPGSGTYLTNQITGETEWVDDAGDFS